MAATRPTVLYEITIFVPVAYVHDMAFVAWLLLWGVEDVRRWLASETTRPRLTVAVDPELTGEDVRIRAYGEAGVMLMRRQSGQWLIS